MKQFIHCLSLHIYSDMCIFTQYYSIVDVASVQTTFGVLSDVSENS